MKLRKYDQAQLREAVKNSTSLRQVLEALGVAPYGGNYEVLRHAIHHFSLDTSHFTGQRWNKGKTVGPKHPLERLLNNEIRFASFKLKNVCWRKEFCLLCVLVVGGRSGSTNQSL